MSGSSLSVAIDFKSPGAYLAFEPTCELADEIGLDVDWLPFLVEPSKRSSSGPDGDRGVRHRNVRAEYLERDIERYAESRGLELRALRRETDSTLAAFGLLWAKREGRPGDVRAYVARVFGGHWRETLDIEDERAIRSVLEELGVGLSGFGDFVVDAGRRELERVREELLEAGVFEVPTYRLDGDVFVGRAHLPMIRWLSSGRSGEPPL